MVVPRVSILCAMGLEDQSHTTDRQAQLPVGGSQPKASIAELLELDSAERESGIWHDDFLWLGSRLRPTYGNRVAIATDPPSYVISFPGLLTVNVSCPLDGERARCVRASARVLEFEQVAVAGIFEFAMRENAELTLARLVARDGWLMAEHDLALCGACIPALEASVSAVALASKTLRAELASAFGLSAE